ncbi:NAD(P)-dependent oxidoreductase [Gemmatimonas aurantiaca]|uniref:NAD-dependent epimerase/dehydratase family protein n=1 Tax=Gemmatimonas aurantiaca TaxID=173480 RepID=UPI00301C1B19
MYERGLEPLLVTGGSGFIGTHVCRQLESQGRPYVILDLHHPDSDLSPSRVVIGDVRNRAAVVAAMQGCSEVLHLAAAHHDSGIDKETYFAVNKLGTENVVEVMMESGVKRICFYSSAAVYTPAKIPATEDSLLRPTNSYGASKLAAEAVLRSYADAKGLSALIIRPSVTFGEGNYANMFSLIRQVHRRRYMHVGRSENRKSLSYVANLVDFTFWAWARHVDGVDVFNWVEAPDLTSREIVEVVASELGSPVSRVAIPLSLALAAAFPIELLASIAGVDTPVNRMRIRKLVVDQTQFSAEKARNAGFKPRVSLESGLRNMVKWYLSLPQATPPIRRLPPQVSSLSVDIL